MVIFIYFTIFLTQVFLFLNTKVNIHPMLDSIFDMIIILSLMIVVVSSKYFSEIKDNLFRKTISDNILDKLYNIKHYFILK